jgi:hypothetical protein
MDKVHETGAPRQGLTPEAWETAARGAQEAAWKKQQADSIAAAQGIAKGAPGVERLTEAVHVTRLDMEGRAGQLQRAQGEIASLEFMARIVESASPELRADVAAKLAKARAHAAQVAEILAQKRAAHVRAQRRLALSALRARAPRLPIAASRRPAERRRREPRRARRSAHATRHVAAGPCADADPEPADAASPARVSPLLRERSVAL